MAVGYSSFILNNKVDRIQNSNVRDYNVQAARGVAEAVRTTLGPKGMDKMLIDNLGDVIVTNDGLTILHVMETDNPAADLVIDVAETQEQEVGDGTTTAVVIAGELMKNAEELLAQGLHPTTISRGFELASRRAREELDEFARGVTPEDRELLRRVAETSMTGRLTDDSKDLFVDLVVDGVRQAAVKTEEGEYRVDTDLVKTERQEGRDAFRSELVCGVAIEKDPVHPMMPETVEDARILLFDQAIELDETEGDTHVSIDNPDQLQRFVDREEREFREKVETIKDVGANVVFVENTIKDLGQHYLAREGILASRRSGRSNIEFVSKVFDATILSRLEDATEADLGHGRVRRDEDHGMFYVEGDSENARGATIVIRGATRYIVDEIERNLKDAIGTVGKTVNDGRVLPGGGAVESKLAEHLRDYANGIGGREQLAVKAFADALDVVPRTLAESAGADPINTVLELRVAHEKGRTAAGIDVFSKTIVDMYEAGVVEPANIKEQTIISATEATNLILRIDSIIDASDLEPDEIPSPEEGGPGSEEFGRS